MIESFRHKRLRRLFEHGDARGLNPEHVERLTLILGVLNAASTLRGVSLPSFDLHPLRGDRRGDWGVTVRANWRVTFRFKGGKFLDVHYEDYH
jgi:toxin HigB-1